MLNSPTSPSSSSSSIFRRRMPWRQGQQQKKQQQQQDRQQEQEQEQWHRQRRRQRRQRRGGGSSGRIGGVGGDVETAALQGENDDEGGMGEDHGEDEEEGIDQDDEEEDEDEDEEDEDEDEDDDDEDGGGGRDNSGGVRRRRRRRRGRRRGGSGSDRESPIDYILKLLWRLFLRLNCTRRLLLEATFAKFKRLYYAGTAVGLLLALTALGMGVFWINIMIYWGSIALEETMWSSLVLIVLGGVEVTTNFMGVSAVQTQYRGVSLFSQSFTQSLNAAK